MKKEYRNIKKTKKVIKDTFIQLLGEKKEMEKITVGELTARADIAKSTFYNHYTDIYAVAKEFEDELIEQLSEGLSAIETEQPIEYEAYVREIISFLKNNEETYRKAITSSDIPFFIEKLKTILSKKMFEENRSLPFSQNEKIRYVQIRFLTNACVDTFVDYFKGIIDMPIEEVGEVVITCLNRLK